MGLTETERKALVEYRLEKAKTTLAEVSILVENKLYGTAVNRLYYACYYAVVALFINDCRDAHTHSGMITLLGQHYITQSKIDKSLGKMYRQLFSSRLSSDYGDWISFDESDVKPYIEPAKEFIATIEKLIASSQ